MLALLLALPASRADDTPKEGKKDPSGQEQYQALLKDFSTRQRDILTEARKVQGEEQQRLLQQYTGLGREFAEKFYKLAEDDPKGPAAADALFWVVQNGAGSPVFAKAADKVAALVGEMPVAELSRRLTVVRGGRPALLDAVLKRAEKDGNDPAAGDLLAWVATTGGSSPAGQKAVDLLVEKHPDHAALERVCQLLGRGGSPESAAMLKRILGKSDKPAVKAAAALALGRNLAAQTDDLGDNPAEAEKAIAEAERYLTMAVEQLGPGGAVRQQAEQELAALKTLKSLRVGKEAPEIKATDLDGKEFKLSDYRGKVVLLDFWGNW
jgi:hypothetical protein